MSIDNLYDFFKKINYRRILPVLLCPVLFLCTSISGYAYNSDSFQFGNAWTFRTTSPNYTLQWQPIRNGSPIGTYTVSFDSGAKSYPLNNSAETGLSSLLFGSSATRFDFELLQDLYDYYLVFNLYSFDLSSDFNLPLELVRFGYYDSGNTLVSSSDFSVISSGDRNDNGYTVICKIPDIPSAALNFFYLVGDIDIPSNLVVEGLFLSFDKDTDSDYVNSVITAINNQTTQQNNNFNNFMGSGSQFGGTNSGIQSGNNELSGYIDEYTQIEQTMHNNFESAQSALIGDFTGFTWGSLANTLNWTSDYMQQIYLNSGDFKMMIILPLLLGVALFFIGRGAIILSNSNKDN